jgi:hypothetical protein
MPDDEIEPVMTRSGDMLIAVVFSKEQAAQLAREANPALFLCVNHSESCTLSKRH